MRKINIAGILLGQSQATTDAKVGINNRLSTEDSSAFHQFLLLEEVTEDDAFLNQLLDSEMASFEKILAELAELPLDLLKELSEKLAELLNGEDDLLVDDQIEELISRLDISLETDLIEQSNIYFDLQTELTSLIDKLSAQESNDLQFSVTPTKSDNPQMIIPESSEQRAAERQFAQLFAQVEALLASLSDGETVSKVSPKILELLEKWTSLENKLHLETNEKSLTNEPKSDEVKLWERLVATFKNRHQMVENQRYQTSAQITSKDVAKWLQNGISNQQSMEISAGTQQANITNAPMSKVEQYVIHINQASHAEPADKQLIDQFQAAIRTSRFLAMNNGVNQLSVALRPDNLGEMMVRLTEVNGEMTLKIIVSSQATRQMLESNVHQLKNMFSPHQVVIEEQEGNIQEAQKSHEEQSFNEHEEDQSQQSNKDDSKESEPNFETDFHELLMNEKV